MAQAKAVKGSAPAPNLFQRLGRYFKDVRSEVKRVVWPTRAEVVNSSVVVLVMLILMTFFVTIVDLAANGLFLEVLAKLEIGR